MTTTIFVPISRAEHLEPLFHSLEVLECDKSQTTLLAYVDGDQRLFEQVQSYVRASKFKDPRCLHRGVNDRSVPSNKSERRKRIAAIKNESKDLIQDCTYVFGIEDDTIVPPNALSKLLIDYAAYPYAGFIEGVELGRHSVPYVGAYRADDVYEPSKIETILPIHLRDAPSGVVHTGYDVEEIDAGAFYCYLTKYENYMNHEYAPFEDNVLGPDVNYGIFLRQQGFTNYIDWSINCEHRTPNGHSIKPTITEAHSVAMVKVNGRWVQRIA